MKAIINSSIQTEVADKFDFPIANMFQSAEVITPVIEVPKQIVAVIVKKELSKADKARLVFNECYAMEVVPQRKDIINRFVQECGLTQNGAATYLQNFKKAAGIVNSK